MTKARRFSLTVQLGLLAAAKCAVGGQAVLEGVMMRSPRAIAIAVRKADGSIVVKDEDWHSITERQRWLKLPLLRGVLMLFETLANGYQALTWSAQQAYGEIAKAEGKAEPKGELSGWALAGTMAFALAFGIVLFNVGPHLATLYLNPLLHLSANVQTRSFNLVDAAIKIAIFAGYILLISRMPDVKRLFQYHGAEHKSIHVFEHAEPLDAEHARKWPRLHPRCGTTFLFFVVLVSMLTYMVVFPLLPGLEWMPKLERNLLFIAIKIPLMLPVAAVSYEIIRIAGKCAEKPGLRQLYEPMMLLQRITTREPDDKQLEVALAALQAALLREEKLLGAPVTAERAVL